MLIVGGNQSGGGYEVANSLRFNYDSSDYLNKTFGTATDRKKFTISTWVKRSELYDVSSETKYLISSGTNASTNIDEFYFRFDTIDFSGYESSTTEFQLRTNAVYRDVTSWYHIVVAYDSTQATSSDMIKLWVNGEQITSFDVETYPSLNHEPLFNSAVAHTIARNLTSGSKYFDGYMSEFCFIDGTALDPTSFGTFDSFSGFWKPRDISGLTFGTNGFYLDFANSASLGNDVSGNSNNFTVNNLTSDDQVPDTPTNNFTVLNSNFSVNNQDLTYSQGSLRVYNPSGTVNQNAPNTFRQKGMPNVYFEGYCVSRGSDPSNQRIQFTFDDNGSFTSLAYRSNGAITIANSVVTTVNSYNTGDIISTLVNNNNVYFYKNNSLEYTYSGTAIDNYNQVNPRLSDNGGEWVLNFGQDSSFGGILTKQNNTDANGIGDFYYSTASSGYAICTKNIAEQDTSIINKPSNHFNTVLYTGTGATQSITGVGFQPDFTWIKQRDGATPRHHILVDSVRGATKYLESDRDIAEVTDANQVASLDSDGFTVGTGNATNSSGINFVAWNWLAGGTPSSNTDGSITSSVSVSPIESFSIVSWTGTGSVGTVGHGLSRGINFGLFKNRSITSDWVVWVNNVAPEEYFKLNDTTDAITDSTMFNDTGQGTGVFTVGTNTSVNGSGNNIIAYLFSSTLNFCNNFFGRGNGSSPDGVYFDVGFRPAWIIIKAEGVSNWVIHDVKRNITNPVNARLFANTDGSEDTTIEVGDITNTGFKARTTNADYNSSGVLYRGYAFAEFPIVDSNGIPLTAR